LITDKMRKVTIFAIFILIIALTICSCSKKNDDLYNNVFTDNGEHHHEHTVKHYRIIIPNDCDAALYEKAMELRKLIADKTETSTLLLREHDAENTSKAEGTRDVLVGFLERQESKSVMKNYKYNDYGYCYKDGAAIIAGVSNSASIKAIEKFCEDVLPYSSCDMLMDQSAEFYHKDSYPINQIKLCGFELSEYSVVYPLGDDSAHSEAIKLRDTIAARSGYYMRVYSDSDVREGTRAINIGRTKLNRGYTVNCPSNEFCISSYSGGVGIYYNGEYSLEAACENMLSLLSSPSTDGNVDLALSTEIHGGIINKEMKFLNVEAKKDELLVNEIIEITSQIKSLSPNLIRLYGYDSKTAGLICDNIGADYLKFYNAESKVCYVYRRNFFGRVSVKTENIDGATIVSADFNYSDNSATVNLFEIVAENGTNKRIAELAAGHLNGISPKSAIIFENFEGDADTVFDDKLVSEERIFNINDLAFYATDGVFTAEDYKISQNHLVVLESFFVRLYKIK